MPLPTIEARERATSAFACHVKYASAMSREGCVLHGLPILSLYFTFLSISMSF